MSEFLRELGYNPWGYWLLAAGCTVLWFFSACFRHDPAGPAWARLNHPAAFGSLLFIAMLACRWPGIFYFRPVNPDEPQFLAGALTMLARGEIWSVDPTTSGPLVVLPLAWPGLFGLPVDLARGRLLALGLSWGLFLFCYLTLRHLFGDRRARWLSLPLGSFLVFQIFWDFVPYTSEYLPLFLVGLALWLGVTAFDPDGLLKRRWRLAGAGVVLGLLPFSKLQALPLGTALGLVLLVWIFRQPPAGRARPFRACLWLLVPTGLACLGMIASLWSSGLGPDVYQSYWVHNVDYARARALPWTSSVYALHYLTQVSWGFAPFHYGLLLLIGLSLPAQRRSSWRPLLLGWLLLAAAYYAVLAPGRLYPHYLLLLSLPLTLLAGLQGGLLAQSLNRRRGLYCWAAFLVVGAGTQTMDRVWDRHAMLRLISTDTSRAPILARINQLRRAGDCLAIWGWRPEFYVETQLPQATREAHTDAQLQAGPQQNYYRARYLADLQAAQPAFFIDSVGPGDFGHVDPVIDGHETFPELRDYLDGAYAPVISSGSFRLYVRRDRLSAPPGS